MNRKNNFDFFRWLFAIFVILSHSFSIGGFPHSGILGRINWGKFGVYGFFIISGFLVSGSLDRSDNWKIFVKKRFYRIFPGLIIMSLFITVLVGLLIAKDKQFYFGNPNTVFHFLSTIALIPIYKCLPEAFSNNPIGCEVNGALWTLRYEILFYFVLSCLFIFKNRPKTVLVSFITAIIGLYVWLSFKEYISDQFNYHLSRIFNLGVYYSFGAFLYYYPRLLRKPNVIIAMIIFILVVIIHNDLLLEYILPLVLPIIIIFAGNLYWPPLKIVSKWGDLSYGIYIYAYPVQQTIVELLRPKHVSTIILLTIFITSILAFLSWHLIEKKFKPRNKINPMVA